MRPLVLALLLIACGGEPGPTEPAMNPPSAKFVDALQEWSGEWTILHASVINEGEVEGAYMIQIWVRRGVEADSMIRETPVKTLPVGTTDDRAWLVSNTELLTVTLAKLYTQTDAPWWALTDSLTEGEIRK